MAIRYGGNSMFIRTWQLHDRCPKCGDYFAQHLQYMDDTEIGPCPRSAVPNRLYGATINHEGDAV